MQVNLSDCSTVLLLIINKMHHFGYLNRRFSQQIQFYHLSVQLWLRTTLGSVSILQQLLHHQLPAWYSFFSPTESICVITRRFWANKCKAEIKSHLYVLTFKSENCCWILGRSIRYFSISSFSRCSLGERSTEVMLRVTPHKALSITENGVWSETI